MGPILLWYGEFVSYNENHFLCASRHAYILNKYFLLHDKFWQSVGYLKSQEV